MNASLLEKLLAEGDLSSASYEKIKATHEPRILSVHWEIRTLLYLGVLLLCAGLGILVYKNIDSIGHTAILLFIAVVCAGCFVYCLKNKLPFSTGKVAAPNSFFDYILLLGCCTFIIFIAYLQYQYNLFGNRYGLATFFPMLVLFSSAYYFDHLGILSMAIASLAAWVGITVTPVHILTSNDFNSAPLIFTGLALGAFLIFLAWASRKKDIKMHFDFTYANFGIHIILISCIAAMAYFSVLYLAWFALMMIVIYFFYQRALQEKSFYFILIITLYAYVAISYVIVRLLSFGDGLGSVYLAFLYFIGSAVGLILFLIRTNKKIKTI